MALVNLDITENYAAFEILTEDQLNEAMQSIETFINTNIKLNFQQIAFDVFGNTYEYNNDGVQTVTPSLSEQIAFLNQDEDIEGARSSTQRSRITDMCCIISPTSCNQVITSDRYFHSSLVTAGRRIFDSSIAASGKRRRCRPIRSAVATDE